MLKSLNIYCIKISQKTKDLMEGTKEHAFKKALKFCL